MRNAIISGASGLVGRSVVKYLVAKNINVICLGRQELHQADLMDIFEADVQYIQIDMMDIEKLPEKLATLGNQLSGDTVFYNFAWGGVNRLTDGSFECQLSNAIYASAAVKAAKQIGCTLFINCGTLEETYAELHFSEDLQYSSSQADYAIAKLASRDMCKIVAYLEKIDYVHTRLSVPLSSDLSMGGYIPRTLKKILDRQDYDPPSNKQLFDIIPVEDVSKAYYLLGLHGKNKKDYFIGSGEPTRLKDYFRQFQLKLGGQDFEENDYSSDPTYTFFNTKALSEDTGFASTSSRFDLQGVSEEK